MYKRQQTNQTIERTDDYEKASEKLDSSFNVQRESAWDRNKLTQSTLTQGESLPGPNDKLIEAAEEQQDAEKSLYARTGEALEPSKQAIFDTTSEQALRNEEIFPQTRTDNAIAMTNGDDNPNVTQRAKEFANGFVTESGSQIT